MSFQLEGVNKTIVMSDNNDGVYTANFVPQQVGEVKVSVCVNGEHIMGSPYSVVVRHFYTSLSTPSRLVSYDRVIWSMPRFIADSRSGKWAVADCINDSVYLYDGENRRSEAEIMIAVD